MRLADGRGMPLLLIFYSLLNFQVNHAEGLLPILETCQRMLSETNGETYNMKINRDIQKFLHLTNKCYNRIIHLSLSSCEKKVWEILVDEKAQSKPRG